MKRKLLIYAISLLLCQLAWADQVSKASALKMARSLLDGPASVVTCTVNGSRVQPKDAEQTAYYIIQGDGGSGWVIMAADDRINPVLAYSDSGTFPASGMPDGLALWLGDLENGINAVMGSQSQAAAGVKARWKALESGGTGTRGGISASKVLTTANWGQDSPFNNACPIMPGQSSRSKTGCLATAMGIVMHYYKWPSSGYGTIGGYYSNGRYIAPYSIDETAYLWRNMPRELSETSDSAQTRQVSGLLYDCAVMAKTDFSNVESGAQLTNACNAMMDNMSYSRSMHILHRSAETAASWYDALCREIDSGRVVLMGVTGEYGGHAAVCDGYDADCRKLHINWGWNGSGNGFYTLDLSVQGYSTFNVAQMAAVCIRPYWMGDAEYTGECHFFSRHGDGSCIIKLNSLDPVAKGGIVSVSVGMVETTSMKDETVSFKLTIEDAAGNVLQELAQRNGVSIKSGWTYSFTERARLDVEPGLYDRIVLYAAVADGAWERVHADYHACPMFEYVECGLTPLPFVNVADAQEPGQVVTLSLSGGYTPWKSVEWSIDGSHLEGNAFTMPDHRVKVSANVLYPDGSNAVVYCRIAVK